METQTASDLIRQRVVVVPYMQIGVDLPSDLSLLAAVDILEET